MSGRNPLKRDWRGQLPRLVAEHIDILQERLLDLSAFSSSTHDLGLGFYSQDGIRMLWRLRLLRADLVVSRRKLRIQGLEYLGKKAWGDHEYADVRRLKRRAKGWINAATSAPALDPEVRLYFHPFRSYVIFNLNRSFAPWISSTPLLASDEGYEKVRQWNLDGFKRISARKEFTAVRDEWNDFALLAIATEPCMYQRAFGRMRFSVSGGLREHRRRVARHWRDVRACYRAIGQAKVKEIHQDLCLTAETLDPNKELHMLLRLARQGRYEGLRGQVGGAMLLLTMAELVRRGAEDAFRIQIKEEDEHGFGFPPDGMKRKFYGADRLLDGDRRAKGEFIRRFGLGHEVRVRWYVEGSTEYHALLHVFGNGGPVEVVNLRGNVVERGGRGVSFRESLRGDILAGRFSFISIDGDRPDSVRLVRKAAADDEICGRFFVSEPDVEFHNFTAQDLERILWSIAQDRGVDPTMRKHLRSAVRSTTTAKGLISEARAALPELSDLSKGELWGRKLMEYAFSHPEDAKGRTRPIVDAVRSAMRGTMASFHHQRKEYRVDRNSGDLVPRSA